MDHKQLIFDLRQSAAWDHELTRFCPADDDIAGFIDGLLSSDDRVAIERHLSECPACVGRVGLVTRLLRDADANGEQIRVMPERPSTMSAPRWAAAATILLAITWLAWTPPETAGPFQETRTIDSLLAQPEILAPSNGLVANRDDFIIRWTEVPGSLYYEVRIVSEAGDLLSQQRVYQTQWELGGDVDLQPNREYFIRVDAYLSDEQSIQSEHIPFRLRE
jgi:hypothetical protein